MGMIDRRIVQTREYHNPHAEEPKLNYSETFPVTVFEAVREEMNDASSTTLRAVIDEIKAELKAKQPLMEARTADYLVTYSGVPGGTGAIQISHKIPWDQTQQSQNRIPTEKAVGEVLFTLGLIDEQGKPINDPESPHIRWSDVIGRPNVYIGLGNAEDGFITQKGVTENIQALDSKISELADEYHGDVRFDNILTDMENHFTNHNNPHDVTIYQLNGVPMDLFRQHADATNPHNMTKDDLGLDEVDNTSDIDKPVSHATQVELDKLQTNIDGVLVKMDELIYVESVTYDQPSGRLKIEFSNGKTEYCSIPIDGLIDEAYYDKETKDITLIELSGHKTVINLSDLIDVYTGSVTSELSVSVDNFVISAELKTNGVDGMKLRDLSVTGRKIAERCITSAKIGEQEVKRINIKDQAVTGEKLFSSLSTGVLAVTKPEADPHYVKVDGDLLAYGAVDTDHIVNLSITNAKLANGIVNHIKLADNSVSTNNLTLKSVTSEKLANNLVLGGNPRLAVRPQANLFNDLIPDTKWVRNYVTNEVFKNVNFDHRSVDGRVLFSSTQRNRVLTVRGANTDPQWGLVNEEMMGNMAISTRTLIDQAVTTDKIATRAIITNKIDNNAITTNKIADRSVTLSKLEVALHPNMVLVTTEKGVPMYSKISEGMFARDAVTGTDVKNNSLPPEKLQTTDKADMILGIHNRGTTPMWTKITSGMINKEAVNGTALFRSSTKNKVLITEEAESDPYWGQINTDMLKARVVTREKIAARAIDHDLLEVRSVDTLNIVPGAITAELIHDGEISPSKLKSSSYDNRVLGVGQQFDQPSWMKITTNMIENEAITGDKIVRSQHANRVLAATSKDAPPEYTQVTGAMITDHSIGSNELELNMVLQGSPELTVNPPIESNDYHLPSTKWVTDKIKEKISKIQYEDIQDLDWQLYAMIVETLGSLNVEGGGGGGGTGDGAANITDERLQELVDDILTDVNYQYGASYDPCMDLAPIDSDRLEFLVNDVLQEFQNDLHLESACDCTVLEDGKLEEMINSSIELAQLYNKVEAPEVVECNCPEFASLKLEELSYDDAEALLEYGKYVEGRVNREALLNRQYGSAMTCPGGIGEEISYERATQLMDMVLDMYTLPDGAELVFEWADILAAEDKNNCTIYGDCKLPYFPYETAKQMVSATFYYVEHDKVTGYHDWIANNLELYELIRGGVTSQAMVLKKYSVSNEYIGSYAIDGRTLFRPQVSNQVLVTDVGGTDPVWSKVENRHIGDRAVTGDKIGMYTVGAVNIDYNAVHTNHIMDWQVTNVKLATDSISPRTLQSNCVTYEKIAPSNVQTVHIEDRAVTSDKIKRRAIVNELIAYDAITTDVIRDRQVTTDKIALLNVLTENLGNECVTTPKLATDSISTPKLRNECVTGDKIQENTIQTKHLSAGCVTAVTIAEGSVHAFHLSSDFSFDARHLGDGSVTGDKIAVGEIESRHLERDLVLKGRPSVEGNDDYARKQLRNVIIMNRPPTEDDTQFDDGDIWYYYS